MGNLVWLLWVLSAVVPLVGIRVFLWLQQANRGETGTGATVPGLTRVG